MRGPREQRVRDVRVIDEEGQAIGIMNVRDALALAQDKGLDLIEVAPQAQPPVCRIMDYGKYKYEQGKRERDQHKKQKQQDVKGIKMRPVTAEHDFQFKAREITHPEIARRLMDKLVEAVADHAVIEKPPTIEGRMMTMVLSPKPGASSAKA